jgi:hypothetical protein
MQSLKIFFLTKSFSKYSINIMKKFLILFCLLQLLFAGTFLEGTNGRVRVPGGECLSDPLVRKAVEL